MVSYCPWVNDAFTSKKAVISIKLFIVIDPIISKISIRKINTYYRGLAMSVILHRTFKLVGYKHIVITNQQLSEAS